MLFKRYKLKTGKWRPWKDVFCAIWWWSSLAFHNIRFQILKCWLFFDKHCKKVKTSVKHILFTTQRMQTLMGGWVLRQLLCGQQLMGSRQMTKFKQNFSHLSKIQQLSTRKWISLKVDSWFITILSCDWVNIRNNRQPKAQYTIRAEPGFATFVFNTFSKLIMPIYA